MTLKTLKINAKKSADNGLSKNSRHQPLALTSPKQRQGSHFEQLACAFLQQQGLTLIAYNWQQPKVGELDLVMIESGQAWSTLVFVEVRQRQRSSFGDASVSVTKAKQNKIIKTAKYFLQQHPEYADYECRFDVMAYNVAAQADNKGPKESSTNNTQQHQPEWLQGAFVATAW